MEGVQKKKRNSNRVTFADPRKGRMVSVPHDGRKNPLRDSMRRRGADAWRSSRFPLPQLGFDLERAVYGDHMTIAREAGILTQGKRPFALCHTEARGAVACRNA